MSKNSLLKVKGKHFYKENRKFLLILQIKLVHIQSVIG